MPILDCRARCFSGPNLVLRWMMTGLGERVMDGQLFRTEPEVVDDIGV